MFKKILQWIRLVKSDAELMDEQYRMLRAFIQNATTANEMIELRKDVLAFRNVWRDSKETKELFEMFDLRLKFVKLLMIKRGSRGNVTQKKRKT